MRSLELLFIPVISVLQRLRELSTARLRDLVATTVVNIKLGQPYDVYIGRATKRVRQGRARATKPGEDGLFANPFPKMGPKEELLELFRNYFFQRVVKNLEFRAAVLALRNRRLGCFCAPAPCHGHIIASWIDAQPEGLLPRTA